jgi:DNA-binding transcriptional MerR regulator
MAEVAQAFKTSYSIKDLEQFSGTKAHTIRIWEKRYGLLRPQRTDTNIRTYSVEELKTLLNISFLNNNGHKISKIANLTPEEMSAKVREVAIEGQENKEVMHSLKLSMLGFDEMLFETVTSRFRETHGFRKLVEEVFVPLLKEIGFLWSTNTICPAQEHFISCLIRRKMEAAINAIPANDAKGNITYVLYLPENELHELGLLFSHFVLRCQGEKVIYLGQSVPVMDLNQIADLVQGTIRFVTVITSYPAGDQLKKYMKQIRKGLPEERFEFMLSGFQVGQANLDSIPKGFSVHEDLYEMLSGLA